MPSSAALDSSTTPASACTKQYFTAPPSAAGLHSSKNPPSSAEYKAWAFNPYQCTTLAWALICCFSGGFQVLARRRLWASCCIRGGGLVYGHLRRQVCRLCIFQGICPPTWKSISADKRGRDEACRPALIIMGCMDLWLELTSGWFQSFTSHGSLTKTIEELI